jgi:ribonuclease Z
MTTSLALRLDNALFLLDAGTGLARLGWDPYRQLLPPAAEPIHLFLTHLHLDHTIGLTFLPALWSNPTIVHVPAREMVDAGPAVFDQLLGGPFFPLAFHDLLPEISLETMRSGETRVEGVRISARQQQHPGGSLGYRVGDMLAFITDAAPDPGTAGFASHVRVLVHEAWRCEGEGSDAGSSGLNAHSSAESAARVAKEADVGELLLSHLPPVGEDFHAAMLARARAIFPRTDLCADGLSRHVE